MEVVYTNAAALTPGKELTVPTAANVLHRWSTKKINIYCYYWKLNFS
jgi:hypothetical protein